MLENALVAVLDFLAACGTFLVRAMEVFLPLALKVLGALLLLLGAIGVLMLARRAAIRAWAIILAIASRARLALARAKPVDYEPAREAVEKIATGASRSKALKAIGAFAFLSLAVAVGTSISGTAARARTHPATKAARPLDGWDALGAESERVGGRIRNFGEPTSERDFDTRETLKSMCMKHLGIRLLDWLDFKGFSVDLQRLQDERVVDYYFRIIRLKLPVVRREKDGSQTMWQLEMDGEDLIVNMAYKAATDWLDSNLFSEPMMPGILNIDWAPLNEAYYRAERSREPAYATGEGWRFGIGVHEHMYAARYVFKDAGRYVEPLQWSEGK